MNRADKLMERFFAKLLRYRVVGLIVLMVPTVWCASALVPTTDLLVDFSFDALLAGDPEATAALESYHREFGDPGDAISVIVTAPTADALWTPEVGLALESFAGDLVAGGLKPQQIRSPLDLPSLHGDTIVENALRRTLQRNPAHYAAAARQLRDHRLYNGRAVSSSGDALVVSVALERPSRAPEARDETIAALPVLVDGLRERLPSTFDVLTIGVPLIEATYEGLALKDLATLIPITALLVSFILWLWFRSVAATALPMLGVALGTIWALGGMQLARIPLDLVNNVIGVVVLVIGVADAVHILIAYRDKRSTTTLSRDRAIVATMVELTPACLMTSVTTAIGFASLAVAEQPAVRDFGLWASAAVMMTFVAQVCVLPIALTFVEPRPAAARVGSAQHDRLAGWVLKHYRRVSIVTLVAVVALAAVATQASSDLRMLEELPSDHPLSHALETTEARLGGVMGHALVFTGRANETTCRVDADCDDEASLGARRCAKRDLARATSSIVHAPLEALVGQRADLLRDAVRARVRRALQSPEASDGGDGDDELIVIDDDSEDVADVAANASPSQSGTCIESVRSPDFVRGLAQLTAAIRGLADPDDALSRVESIADLIADITPPAAGLIGDARTLNDGDIRDRFTLLASAPDVVAGFITADDRRAAMRLLANDRGSRAWQRLEKHAEVEIARHFGPDTKLGARFTVHRTGTATVAGDALDSIMVDLGASIAWAMLGLLLVFAVVTRDVALTLLSMVANCVPLIATLAVMALLGISIRVSTVIIFSVAFGIAVDDTIHVVHRLRRELGAGREPEDAVRVTMRTTGRALTLTSAILIVGFAVNVASGFVAIQQFGLFAALTLALALIVDLVSLPAAVFWIARNRTRTL